MEKLRVKIMVSVIEGAPYSYEHLAEQDVELVGSPDGLATLNIAGLVSSLYRDTLHQAREAKEGGE